MSSNWLYLNQINVKKPNLYKETEYQCPFCNIVEKDSHSVIAQHETLPIVIVENKYPTLTHMDTFVLVETDDCQWNMRTYDTAYVQQLLQFALDYKEQLEASGKYKTVLLLKNNGQLSGGSVPHGHMQIIGVLPENTTKFELQTDTYSTGCVMQSDDVCKLQLLKHPTFEPYEFELSWQGETVPYSAAEYLQNILQFQEGFLNGRYQDYNLLITRHSDRMSCHVYYRGTVGVYKIAFGATEVNGVLDELPTQYQQFLNEKGVSG